MWLSGRETSGRRGADLFFFLFFKFRLQSLYEFASCCYIICPDICVTLMYKLYGPVLTEVHDCQRLKDSVGDWVPEFYFENLVFILIFKVKTSHKP